MHYTADIPQRMVKPDVKISINVRIAWLVSIMIASVSAPGRAADPADIHFENSCSAEVAELFDHGVTMLHSFEYPETTRIFAAVTERDPSCVMAYWGSAMSLWHPLWAPPGSEDLQLGRDLLGKTRRLDATDRERDYVDALAAFFSSTDPHTHAERAAAYSSKMRSLQVRYPHDSEATVFYALALLAVADPRDKTYAQQLLAAELLEKVGESQALHPGVLHYTIHSYDYPALAERGLEAATIYADAAPDSAHAQHMPSHIFTRLGLWDQSLASNHNSTRSAADYTERARLPGHYDEGLHSIDYLMYAMLQTARDTEALALLEQLASIERTDTENFKVAYTYASSPARYALERRQWHEAADLEFIREDFAWDDFGFAQSILYFARGIGAARSGQLDRARAELAHIRRLQAELPDETLPYWREQVQVHADAVNAWILLGEGNRQAALVNALAAADREDAVDKHPVTPGEVLPARELYADLLLTLGEHGKALVEYQQVLGVSPNRLNAILGAARAAHGHGKFKLEAEYRATAKRQAANGNGDRFAEI